MMGHEHYMQAQHLLERANDATSYGQAANIIAQAQVHATLALVAATVDTAGLVRVSYVQSDGTTLSYVDDHTLNRWTGVTS